MYEIFNNVLASVVHILPYLYLSLHSSWASYFGIHDMYNIWNSSRPGAAVFSQFLCKRRPFLVPFSGSDCSRSNKPHKILLQCRNPDLQLSSSSFAPAPWKIGVDQLSHEFTWCSAGSVSKPRTTWIIMAISSKKCIRYRYIYISWNDSK